MKKNLESAKNQESERYSKEQRMHSVKGEDFMDVHLEKDSSSPFGIV